MIEPRAIQEVADVTPEVIAAAEEAADWFQDDEPIDWDRFWDKFDTSEFWMADELSPAANHIVRHVRAYRRSV